MAATEGKKPCEFSGYRMLAEKALGLERSFNQLLFVHPFTIMCWNLAARSVSVGGLMYDHITWEGDSLVVTLPKTKNNQEGVDVYPKHVYANVLDPIICPVLALGIKLLSTPFVDDGTAASEHIMVFNGYNSETRFDCFAGRPAVRCVQLTSTCQLDRYCQWLSNLLCELSDEEQLQLGVDPKEFGSHSFRKGVCTLSSSLVSGPPITSIFLRAGWTLGAVQQRYEYNASFPLIHF